MQKMLGPTELDKILILSILRAAEEYLLDEEYVEYIKKILKENNIKKDIKEALRLIKMEKYKDFKMLIAYMGDYQGDIIAMIQIDNSYKFLYIQLVYGSCEGCDPIRRYMKDYHEYLDNDTKSENIPDELIERIANELIKPAIIEDNRDKLINRTIGLGSLICYTRERIKNGRISMLEDNLNDIWKIIEIDNYNDVVIYKPIHTTLFEEEENKD